MLRGACVFSRGSIYRYGPAIWVFTRGEPVVRNNGAAGRGEANSWCQTANGSRSRRPGGRGLQKNMFQLVGAPGACGASCEKPLAAKARQWWCCRGGHLGAQSKQRQT